MVSPWSGAGSVSNRVSKSNLYSRHPLAMRCGALLAGMKRSGARFYLIKHSPGKPSAEKKELIYHVHQRTGSDTLLPHFLSASCWSRSNHFYWCWLLADSVRRSPNSRPLLLDTSWIVAIYNWWCVLVWSIWRYGAALAKLLGYCYRAHIRV